ncbi:MAG: uroporphyrinogen-III synthase, partial [Gemmatimonadaceae bacterium]
LGATVLHYPILSFAPPQNIALLQDAVATIAHYDWLVFTSANAVQSVADQVMEQHGHLNINLPAIATVGHATAAAVTALGWTVHYIAARGGGLALASELPVAPDAKILLPRADIASADVPNVLRDRECTVNEVVAYRTVSTLAPAFAVLGDMSHVDAITFTSPSTVAAFAAAATAAKWNIEYAQQHGRLIVACIGETTATAVRQHQLAADVVAADQSSEGLIEALARELHHRYNKVGVSTQDLRSF